MLLRRFMSSSLAGGLAAAAFAAVPAAAEDASVAERLDAEGMKHDVDEDGDYKVTYNYTDEKRSQNVYVSGKTETVGGLVIREVFAAAARVEGDGITGAKARELLENSGQMKLGSWEIRGDYLYLVAKVLDSASAKELHAMIDVVAEVADNMEIELSGDRDDL